MSAALRPAVEADLDQIVTLTRRQRDQLKNWSPIYFNPREGSDDAHAGFLGFLVRSPDHETVVVEADTSFGFFVRIHQPDHLWIDDLCISDSDRWVETINLVNESSPVPWVTCVSVRDELRLQALQAIGAQTISTYHSLTSLPSADLPSTDQIDLDAVRSDRAARHTFGGCAFSPEAPGALIVADADHGYAVGSASMSPPIYDPGGPTSVIDQIIGRDRASVLNHAIDQASARGDTQIVVVIAEHDRELATIAAAAGFETQVALVGMLATNS